MRANIFEEFNHWSIPINSYDSKIITLESSDFVGEKLIEGKSLKLLYRGSVHGFKA
jgi:hypothetical protein